MIQTWVPTMIVRRKLATGQKLNEAKAGFEFGTFQSQVDRSTTAPQLLSVKFATYLLASGINQLLTIFQGVHINYFLIKTHQNEIPKF